MDDFLYVLLGVAWLAWSLYSNKQKMDKKRAAQQQGKNPGEELVETQQPRSIFDELFEEKVPEVLEAEEEVYIPEVEENEYNKKQAKYYESEAQSQEAVHEEVSADYFARQYASGYSVVVPTANKGIVYEEIIKEKETVVAEIEEDFDLRKAILYSEILKAPYIDR